MFMCVQFYYYFTSFDPYKYIIYISMHNRTNKNFNNSFAIVSFRTRQNKYDKNKQNYNDKTILASKGVSLCEHIAGACG